MRTQNPAADEDVNAGRIAPLLARVFPVMLLAAAYGPSLAFYDTLGLALLGATAVFLVVGLVEESRVPPDSGGLPSASIAG